MSTDPRIIFLATRWGEYEGGVNVFNYRLVRELAKLSHPNNIFCVVDSATDEEVDAAALDNVTLITAPLSSAATDPDSYATELLQTLPKECSFDFVVGHDVITGVHALTLAIRLRAPSVALNHQSYASYNFTKHNNSTSYLETFKAQQDLFSAVDFAFAAGPMLYDILLGVRLSKPTYKLVPGMEAVDHYCNTSSIECALIGRLENDNRRIKGIDLAVAAFGRAVKLLGESDSPSLKTAPAKLKLIGYDHASLATIDYTAVAEREAETAVQVMPIPYATSSTFETAVQGTNLVLMPSFHEGFGLAAWEAIGRGVPVIATTRSGFYRQLLNDHLSDKVKFVEYTDATGTELYGEADLVNLSKAISDVYNNFEIRKKSVEFLRATLPEKYSWQETALQFLNSLNYSMFVDSHRYGKLLTSAVATGTLQDLSYGPAAEKLHLARVLHDVGRYAEAQSELDDVIEKLQSDPAPRAKSMLTQAYLQRAETHVRHCKTDAALADSDKALELSGASSNWHGTLAAYGIQNTALRDVGRYPEAAQICYEMKKIADTHVKEDLGKCLRDTARTFALLKLPQGIDHARDALRLAKESQSAIAVAKSYLAIGECHRLALNDQSSAVESYLVSLNIARQQDHYDCYIWASLGLSDSLILLDQLVSARDVLEQIREVITRRDKSFELETLHLELGLASIEFLETGAWPANVSELVERYESRGVKWPATYTTLRAGSRLEAKTY